MTRAANAPPHGRVRSIVGFASLVLVLFLLIAGFRGFRDLTLARQRAAELELGIAEAEGEVVRLRRRIERLRDDPELLERLAREELGMVRPGEIVVLLEHREPRDGAGPGPAATLPTPPAAAPSSGPPAPGSP